MLTSCCSSSSNHQEEYLLNRNNCRNSSSLFLPNDILMEIYSFLSQNDSIKLSCVSKSFRNILLQLNILKFTNLQYNEKTKYKDHVSIPLFNNSFLELFTAIGLYYMSSFNTLKLKRLMKLKKLEHLHCSAIYYEKPHFSLGSIFISQQIINSSNLLSLRLKYFKLKFKDIENIVKLPKLKEFYLINCKIDENSTKLIGENIHNYESYFNQNSGNYEILLPYIFNNNNNSKLRNLGLNFKKKSVKNNQFDINFTNLNINIFEINTKFLNNNSINNLIENIDKFANNFKVLLFDSTSSQYLKTPSFMNLKELYLDNGNNLQNIKKLPSLEFLSIFERKPVNTTTFIDITQIEVPNLKNLFLETLSVYLNHSNIDNFIINFPNLEFLHLGNESVDPTLKLKNITELKYLTKLSIAFTSVPISIKYISKLEQLKYLNLTSRISLKEFEYLSKGKLTNLTYLDIGYGNEMTSSEMEYIASSNMINLQHLRLCRHDLNCIYTLSTTTLRNLKSILLTNDATTHSIQYLIDNISSLREVQNYVSGIYPEECELRFDRIKRVNCSGRNCKVYVKDWHLFNSVKPKLYKSFKRGKLLEDFKIQTMKM